MTVDQLLYVASRIHNWDDSVDETVKRSIEICMKCELAAEAKENYDKMKADGLGLQEMLAKVMREMRG